MQGPYNLEVYNKAGAGRAKGWSERGREWVVEKHAEDGKEGEGRWAEERGTERTTEKIRWA